MNERLLKRLFDARAAAASAVHFVADCTRDDYLSNDLLRSGVERKLEIVGEALNRAQLENKEVAFLVPDLRRIVGLRNRIIPGYDDLDDLQIWAIVRDNIPDLIQQLNRVLDENQDVPL